MKKWIDKAGRLRLGTRVGGPESLIIREEKEDHHFNNEENFVTTYVVVPPDKGWGWVVVATAFFYAIVYDGILFNFGMIYLEILSAEFGNSKKEVALVIALFQATQQIFGPIASGLTNRYGFQRVCILGSIICTVSVGVCYFATSIIYLWIVYGLMAGTGSGLIFMASSLCVSFYFQRWRPLAVCLASCGANLGGIILGPILRVIMDNYGWRTTMLFKSCLFFVCACLGVLFRPIKPIKITKEIDKDKESIFEYAASRNATIMSFAHSSANASSVIVTTETGILGPTNLYYPTAAALIRRESEQSMMSKNPSFMSMQPSWVGIPSQTLDMISPVWDLHLHSESQTSMRIVVGQDVKNIQSYWRKPVHHRFPCLRKVFFCLRSEDLVGVRPLYRDDIFFEGSVLGLPQAQLGSMGLNLAVTRMATQKDIEEEKSTRCICCPVAVRRTLATMLNLSLFKSASFLLFLAHCSIFQFAYVIPLIFLTDRASEQGLDTTTISLFVPLISISGLLTKVVLGVISSVPKVSIVLLNNCVITLGGLNVIVIGFTSNAILQLTCCVMFGIMIATFFGLRTLIAVQMLGLENLTNAFGLVLLFSGIATVLSPPFAGWFREITSSYDAVFWLAGGLILLSASLMYPITWVNKRERRKMKISNEDVLSIRERRRHDFIDDAERKKKDLTDDRDV